MKIWVSLTLLSLVACGYPQPARVADATPDTLLDSLSPDAGPPPSCGAGDSTCGPGNGLDIDGDGFKSGIGGGDCDDHDPSIHPGASEVVNNRDDDCDGFADDLGGTPSTDNQDRDGDGHTIAQGDCDDTNPTIYRGMAEICGDGLDNDCDGVADNGCYAGTVDCCASSVVAGNAAGATMAGAPFFRSYDVATDGMYQDPAFPAKVSDFRLDTYEVTVGRFRAFVNAGLGTRQNPPATGAGAHQQIAGSGWDASFTTKLTGSTFELVTAVKCSASWQTWTDTPGANEELPINCVTWYEAMAFCIWDGGYLPTEAEWNYAASGGDEQRAYPWSSPADSLTIDCGYANYPINIPSGRWCVNTAGGGGANRVGSESPKGDGRWGQADLAGNLSEWQLDWASMYSDPCNDCANLVMAASRSTRGGNFQGPTSPSRPGGQRVALRGAIDPGLREASLGFRCARPR